VRLSLQLEFFSVMALAVEEQSLAIRAVAAADEISQRRLDRIASHLRATSLMKDEQLAAEVCAAAAKVSKRPVSVSVLTHLMAGGYPEDRQKVLDFFLKRPDLETPVEITKEQHRELAYKQLLAIVREAGVNPMKYLMEDPGQYFALLEAVGYIDMSLAIKLGVQFSLWGGSVVNLGTQKHRDKYLEGISTLRYPGCFAMTELHHGRPSFATLYTPFSSN
jgi:acyl-CoA oxidase